MRKSLLLYLFVFTALLAVYIYVSGQSMLKSKEEKIEQLQEDLILAEQKVESLSSDAQGQQEAFSLVTNEEALSYLENRGLDPSEVIEKVESELISRNKADADNDLVPYEGMDGHFRINKIKLLNQKWILASFTDGTYWGDLFLTYEIGEDRNLEITTQEALLYTPN
ncbi:hypothetical protein SAMN04488034_102448 [Salinimicrobium catena]|uniref:Hydrolase n=1 Tax=Salinimicrobium catena TaxID=390640 RepID=A0A1H5LW11_9FLAO|nr:hypothetical protein [Salinimicrobium catena]SDL15295.1 hypothetical protein SAMN04488140_102448 [Salinimicrobium catena]SEE81273.1 hypothetical protein SAMN04488034_102448 [Salinimicrobium catena]